MIKKRYDLAIIGGGAAGMLAAGRAAELGANVVLLEKNRHLGVKLALTGKGRCNITNGEEDFKKLINIFGKNGKFLYAAFNKFSNFDTISFFEDHGVKTKIERGGRVMPFSDSAKDVVNCLIKYMNDNNVDIRKDSGVEKIIIFSADNGRKKIQKVILKNGEELFADNYLLASGGKSYPRTGSNGEAFGWLEKIGHTIIKPKPALTPIMVKEKIVGELEGLSLKNVEISIWNERKLFSEFGEALFTGNGLSGPIILDLSRDMCKIDVKNLKIKIDFKPALDYQTLDRRILRDFEELKTRQFKNGLNKLLPKKLIPVIIKLSGIDEEKKISEITKIERKKLIHLLKEFEFTVKSLVGFEKAIVTAGGVNLKEINPKTMKSKMVDNLYFAGEILDIDGPTGGYNLQVAWSSAYLAAESITFQK
jgi:predicted Rossmann fold flavoprotein